MISRSKSQRNVGGSGVGGAADRVSFSDRGSSLAQDPRGSLVGVGAGGGGGEIHTPHTIAVKTPVGKGGKVGLGQIKEEEATSPQTPPDVGKEEEGESVKLTMPPPPPDVSSKAPSPSAKVPSGTGSASPSRKANGSSKPPLSGDASASSTASLEHTPETKVSLQQRANLAAKAAEQNLIVDALANSSSNFPVPSKTPRPHTDLENRNTPSLYSSRANTSSVRMTGKDQPVTPGSGGRSSRTMSVRMSPSSNGQQTNTAQKRLSFALTGSAASVIAGGLDLS